MIKKYRFFTSLLPLKNNSALPFHEFQLYWAQILKFCRQKNKASIQKNKKNFAAQAIIVSCRMNLARNWGVIQLLILKKILQKIK